MRIPLFDAHCDTLSRILEAPGRHLAGNGGQWDLDRVVEFSPQAQIFAVFADAALPGAREKAAQQIAVFHRECQLFQDRVVPCTSSAQAEEAAAQGKVAAVLSVEGAELLRGCGRGTGRACVR